MATDIATLGIKIEAKDIQKAVAELDRLEKQSGKTEKATDGISKSYGKLKAAIAAVGVAVLTKQLLDQINTYTALTNKLKLVTDGTENLADMQAILFDTAQDTRASLEGTIDLYSRLARSTKQLGVSQEELTAVTETINKAIAVSGSTAQEAQAALFQLGQGLSAGALRGEELNSVLEQTPRLAQAIADGLGVTISQLREMGAAGELNAEAVINALQNQSATIASEFDQTEKTISQALTQIQNSVLQTFGSLDGSELVEAMDSFRATIEDPAIVEGLQSIAAVMVTIVELGVQAAAGWGMIFQLFTDNRTEIQAVLDEIKITNEEMQSAIDKGATGIDGFVDKLKGLGEEYGRLTAAKREFEGKDDDGNDKDAGSGGISEALQEDLNLQAQANSLSLLLQQEHNSELLLLDEEQKNSLNLANSLAVLQQQEFADAERAIREKSAADAIAIENRKSSQIINMAGNVASAAAGFINALPGEHDKAAKAIFVIQKGLAIAESIVNTQRGVAASLPLDPTGIMAGRVEILGNIATGLITATALLGGGSGSSGGGSISQSGTTSGAADLPATAPPQQGSGGGSLQVIINGNFIGNEEFLNDVILPGIAEAVDERDFILIGNDSRQADEFREQTA